MTDRNSPTPRVKVVHVVLILAACFAVGSAGLFLAVIRGRVSSSHVTLTTPQQPLSVDEKSQILDNLQASGNSSSTIATKLQILQSLDSSH
jgi:hypothetical protein